MAQVWQATQVSGGKRPDGRHWLTAARHPTRRDGTVALLLLFLPGVALVLWSRHHRLDAAAVGILVSVALGLPVLWLTWAAYREAQKSAALSGSPGLPQVANRLALAVGRQWEAEAAIRRLNDPYPLPVSWVAADASLTDPWDSLLKLAGSGAGWPPAPPTGSWAAGPEDLGGSGGELVKVLDRVPTGRLVVLGEPGAGKTMLMVRLVLDLLAHRANGGPVPILASVASWDPGAQDLRDWLAARLLIDHPSLAAAPQTGVEESTQAAALLASGLIMPILDGLDEIPEHVRGPAISRINDTLRSGDRLVVTCRSQQYRTLSGHKKVSKSLSGEQRPFNCSGWRLMPSANTSAMTRVAQSPGRAGTLFCRCSTRMRRPGRH
jgi:hypothetical protein